MAVGDLITSILAGGVVGAVSIIFVSIGETFNERAGVMNTGHEATITLSSFVALFVTSLTGNYFLGTLAAIFTGAIIGLLHSIICVKMRVNQLIAGMLLLAFSAGLANLLYSIVVDRTGVPTIDHPLPPIHIPFLSDIPVIGEILFQHNIFVYLAFFLAIVFGVILFKTTWGLKIRAVGENPEASDAAGINVNLIRYLCDIFSGVMTGLAGAAITIGYIGIYDANIAAGRGWIAIIVVIFSRWNPYRAILGSLIFGIGYSLAANLIGVGSEISYYFLLIVPYLAALVVIVIFVRNSKGPLALTVPYWRK